MRQYLLNTLENSEIKMDRQAIDLFLRLTDLDLSKMMRELQKILLYGQEQEVITVKEIEQLVPKTLEHNLFDMTQYILSGRTEQALRLFQDLVTQGEETIKINAILLSQIRLFLQTKFLVKIGYQQANIAETLKIHPYRVKLAMQEVRKFNEQTLRRLFDELVEMDYEIKSGKIEKELSFQLFVLRTGELLKR